MLHRNMTIGAVFAILAGLALSISVVSLVFAIYAVRKPPELAEFADLKARYAALDQEVTDLNDRVGQWMRRESVRRLRESKEQSIAALAPTAHPDETPKQALRRRVFSSVPKTIGSDS